MLRSLLVCLFLALLLGAPAVAQPVSDGGRHCEDHPMPDDDDCDTIANARDNCRTIANVEQVNTDRGYTRFEPPAPEEPGAEMVEGDDGAGDSEFNGDECDPDDDADGVPDASDNCQFVRNPGQRRTQDPVAGDACATDGDQDGVVDGRDNCPGAPNPQQENLDRDGLGDVCDADDDADGRGDASDNCPAVANSEQGDADGDGIGTACDPGEASQSSGAPAAPPAEASADRTAPALTLSRTSTWTSGNLRGRAPFAVRCSEACGLTARLTLRGRLVAAGSAFLGAEGRTYVFLVPRRAALRRVARLRRPAAARLSVRAVDEAGNRRTVTRRVKLRR